MSALSERINDSQNSSTDIHWPGSHDAPPPDVPECGFLGNDPECQGNGTHANLSHQLCWQFISIFIASSWKCWRKLLFFTSLFVFFTAVSLALVWTASQISKLPSQLNHANRSLEHPRNRHRLQLAVLRTLRGVHLVTFISLLQVRLMARRSQTLMHLLIGCFPTQTLLFPDNCSWTVSTTWRGVWNPKKCWSKSANFSVRKLVCRN